MDEEHGLLVKVTIEVVGKPKEHIENTLRLVIDKIRKDEKNIKLKQGDLYKAKELKLTTEQQGEFWSTFAELDLHIKDIQTLVGFCFEYSPSVVEIIEPQEMRFNIKDFSDLLTDLLAKLHQMGMFLKELKAENQVLNRNGASLLRNIVMMSVREKDMTCQEIANYSGIDKDKLKPFLDEFVKGGLLKDNKGKYSLLA